eukprot:m.31517 g.31517  ORF g.31517 m.31517 type:complete len:363 (-) comp6313_c0_seq4:84-1172(-)
MSEIIDAVKNLMNEVPSNRKCADCKSEHITACVFPYGIFVCRACADCHKLLQKSTSIIKSFEDDDWTNEDLDTLKEKGNLKNKETMEATLPVFILRGSPIMNIELRKAWIFSKYDAKHFNVGGPQFANSGEIEGTLMKRGKAPGSKWLERYCKIVSEEGKFMFKYWLNRDDPAPKQAFDVKDAFIFFEEGNPLQFNILFESRRLFFEVSSRELLYSWINVFRAAQARAVGWTPDNTDKRFLAEMDRYLNANSMSGMLDKSNPKGGNFKPRFFIMSGLLLQYAKSEEDSDMLGVIKLGTASQGTRVSMNGDKLVLTVPGTERQYTMKGSKSELSRWAETINETISYCPKFGTPADEFNSRETK